jgi:chromosome segregation ATPase
MTENQEKQLFKTLETLVSGMQVIQTDVKEIKVTLGEHSQILESHSQILEKHSQILESHSQILERLDAKTDTIAEKVMNHEIRLTKAENDIEELRGGVY